MFLETGLSSVMETESIHILLSRELNIMTFKKSWGDLSPRVWQQFIVWIKLLALNFIMHVLRRRERTLWDHLSLVTSLKFFLFELRTESCPFSILKIIASFPFFIEHCGKNFLLMSRLTEASLMAVDDPLLWVFIDSFFLEASHPDTLYFILISGIVFISSNFLKKHILLSFLHSLSEPGAMEWCPTRNRDVSFLTWAVTCCPYMFQALSPSDVIIFSLLSPTI